MTTATQENQILEQVPKQLLIGGEWRDGGGTLPVEDPATKLILPGVGAFRDAMANLREYGLLEPFVEKVKAGTPALGICLGMHLLFTESEEFGLHRGLDLLKGRVIKLPTNLRVPHMGWNQLHPKRADALTEGVQYRQREDRAERRLASTLTGVGGLAGVMAVLTGVLFAGLGHQEPSLPERGHLEQRLARGVDPDEEGQIAVH